MVAAVLFFTPHNAGAQYPCYPGDSVGTDCCGADSGAGGYSWDLGICDTLYVETFDCDHTYEAEPGSFDSVRVAIYVTHDSNTFYSEGLGQWVQDSIRAFVIPLVFWPQPEGTADSVIFPFGNPMDPNDWNNTIISDNPNKMGRSMFRHIVDDHTGDTTYNRMLRMVENWKWPWTVTTGINPYSDDYNLGHVYLSLIPIDPNCQAWWEGSRELLATLTFHVYMSEDCDTTEIGLDSTLWPPDSRLYFVRYDAVRYIPRHFLPVKDTIYTVLNQPPEISCPNPEIQHTNGIFTTTTTWYAFDPESALVVPAICQAPGGPIICIDVNVNWSTAGSAEGTVDYVVIDHCQGDPYYNYILLIAWDDQWKADTCSLAITLYNSPPGITCPDDMTGPWNQTMVSGEFSTSDPDNDEVVVFISNVYPNPPNAPIIEDSQVVWIPTYADVGVWYTVELTCTDVCDATHTCWFTMLATSAPGDNCDLPIEIDLPGDLPYIDLGQTTCGRGDDYSETCLGSYDDGEDIIYQLNITEAIDVDITLDPKTSSYTGIAVDSVCAPGDPCIAYSTNSSASPYGITELHLDPGTYYIMIDIQPTPDCIPDFDLTITEHAAFADVTAGEDQSGATKDEVSVMFYIQNIGLSTDTFDLDITSSLGWDIDPQHIELTLDPSEIDSVSFTVSIPNVPLGTSDRVTLEAIPQSNPDGGDSDSLTVTCNYYGIEIMQIADVPNDQGKQVRIEWLSFTDFDSSVTFFTIFRRIDSLLFVSGGNLFEVSDLFDYPPGRWEVVGTIPAFGETLYATIVPTLKDSTISDSMHYSVFFIRAGTDNPYVYFDSPIDSGYSLDNLSPSPPTALLASHEPAVTKLTWSPTTALDFDYYTLYRDTLSEFTPGLSNRLGFAIDTIFVDSTAELGKIYYYLASATDFSGNESDPSNQAMGVSYVTGDANADEYINISDVVYLILYLFSGGSAPNPLEAGDCTCDDMVNIADVVYLVNYLFTGGPPPPPSC